MKRPMPEARAWLNYVTVQSIDETLAQAQKLGAMVTRPKSAVPKMGWFAILLDPEQNVFAVWQDDPNAG
jgi:predicted enzyme related to lactoylglutathione lyase